MQKPLRQAHRLGMVGKSRSSARSTATDQLGPFYRLGIGGGQGPEAPALHNLHVNIHNLRERLRQAHEPWLPVVESFSRPSDLTESPPHPLTQGRNLSFGLSQQMVGALPAGKAHSDSAPPTDCRLSGSPCWGGANSLVCDPRPWGPGSLGLLCGHPSGDQKGPLLPHNTTDFFPSLST